MSEKPLVRSPENSHGVSHLFVSQARQARISPTGMANKKTERNQVQETKNQDSHTKSVDSSGLQDVVRLESQGPDRGVKSGHGGREAAEHRKVDLKKLQEDPGELSVEEFDIVIANVVPKQSGVVLLPEQRVDADPLDKIHHNVRPQAERVGGCQAPGNDTWNGDLAVAEETQYLHLDCNLLVGVLVTDAPHDGHAEQPGGAIAKAHLLAQVVRTVEEITVQPTLKLCGVQGRYPARYVACNASLVDSLDPSSLLDVVDEFDGLVDVHHVDRRGQGSMNSGSTELGGLVRLWRNCRGDALVIRSSFTTQNFCVRRKKSRGGCKCSGVGILSVSVNRQLRIYVAARDSSCLWKGRMHSLAATITVVPSMDWVASIKVPAPVRMISSYIENFWYPRGHAEHMESEEELHEYLLSTASTHGFNSTEDYDKALNKAKSILAISHRVVFTHGDFKAHNILVDDEGHLSGFLDWESAGWCPEYWEFTTAMRFGRNSWWYQVALSLGGNQYLTELECDVALNSLTVDSYIGM